MNHRIDLQTFNEIYHVILQDCVFSRISITWLIGGGLRIGPRTNTRAAKAKPDPPHPYTSAGPLCVFSLIRRTFSLLFLLHTHFVRRTFYPSSGRSTLPLDVLPFLWTFYPSSGRSTLPPDILPFLRTFYLPSPDTFLTFSAFISVIPP